MGHHSLHVIPARHAGNRRFDRALHVGEITLDVEMICNECAHANAHWTAMFTQDLAWVS
jgi:hypothetical protein